MKYYSKPNLMTYIDVREGQNQIIICQFSKKEPISWKPRELNDKKPLKQFVIPQNNHTFALAFADAVVFTAFLNINYR